MSDTRLSAFVSLGTSEPFTVLHGLLKHHFGYLQFHNNEEVEMAVHE
jgi:hypothetical protein